MKAWGMMHGDPYVEAQRGTLFHRAQATRPLQELLHGAAITDPNATRAAGHPTQRWFEAHAAWAWSCAPPVLPAGRPLAQDATASEVQRALVAFRLPTTGRSAAGPGTGVATLTSAKVKGTPCSGACVGPCYRQAAAAPGGSARRCQGAAVCMHGHMRPQLPEAFTRGLLCSAHAVVAQGRHPCW